MSRASARAIRLRRIEDEDLITLTVTRVHREVDMRGIHEMAENVHCHGLRCELFVNRAQTIARLINNRVIITCYAKEGEQFDMPTIERMVASLQLRVIVAGSEGKVIDLAEKREETKRRKTA